MSFLKSNRGISGISVYMIAIAIIALVVLGFGIIMSNIVQDSPPKFEDYENGTNTSMNYTELDVELIHNEIFGIDKQRLTLQINLGDHIKSGFNSLNFHVYEDEDSYPQSIITEHTGDMYEDINIIILLDRSVLGSQDAIAELLTTLQSSLESQEKKANIAVFAFNDEIEPLLETDDPEDLLDTFSSDLNNNGKRYFYDNMIASAATSFEVGDANMMIIFTKKGAAPTKTNIETVDKTKFDDIQYARSLIKTTFENLDVTLYVIPVDDNCNLYESVNNYIKDGRCDSNLKPEILSQKITDMNQVQLTYKTDYDSGDHNITVRVFKDDLSGALKEEINYG